MAAYAATPHDPDQPRQVAIGFIEGVQVSKPRRGVVVRQGEAARSVDVGRGQASRGGPIRVAAVAKG